MIDGPEFSRLHSAIEYVVDNVPGGVLRTQLVKLLYLADRKSVLETGTSITGCQYTSYHYGPYCEDIIEAATDLDGVEIQETRGSGYNGNTYYIYRSGEYHRRQMVPLDKSETKILDETISRYGGLPLRKLLDCVYETREFKSAAAGGPIDLTA